MPRISLSHSVINQSCRLANSLNVSKTIPKYDAVIVGGGIVGLATARELSIRYPNFKFALLEKEHELSLHQSKNNSGVIHAGIYYQPGSLKAKLCLEGMKKSYKYLDRYNIPYKKVGKLIVAVNDQDVSRLDHLMVRAKENGVPGVRMMSANEITEMEPYCVGKKALFSPETGIVDWGVVAKSFAKNFKDNGGRIFVNFEANKFEEAEDCVHYPVVIQNRTVLQSGVPSFVQSKYVITCCGLQSDRVAQKTGCLREPRIIPFRGDYLKLKPNKSDLIKCNIYPVPDPRFPFLGVHFTPRIDGSVWLGPTAILSLAREGYGYFDFNFKDAKESLGHLGLLRLAKRYFSFGADELVSHLLVDRQVKKLQRYVPTLRREDVERGPSGIRAQALGSDGQLVDDFVIDCGKEGFGKRIMHVRNAPSPAATSSLAIARELADMARSNFQLPEGEPRDDL